MDSNKNQDIPANVPSQDLLYDSNANLAYLEQIKKDQTDSTPIISDLLDLSVLKFEWEGGKFEKGFDQLQKRYSQVRRLQRDGNCFYRAFLYQLYEHFIQTKGDLYNQYLKIATESFKDLIENCGCDETGIEWAYEPFIEAVKEIKTTKPEDAAAFLEATLCTDNNITIYYARLLTAGFLKKNKFLYEDFIGDVEIFCQNQVTMPNFECDHPQIMGITGALNLGVEINSLKPDGTVEVINLPEDGYDGFRPKLLFVPGHYDALYM